jgi:hypothetical protein
MTKIDKRPASPLRAALAAKTNLRTYHDIAVVDSEQVQAAQRQLELARQLQAASLLSDEDAVRAKALQAVERAQATRNACFHRIWFRSLGHTEFDALVALHPAADGQVDELPWNPATFDYALLEACVVDSDLTAEEWEAELADEKRWSAPDRNRVISMALAAQRQTMADAVPKD